MIFHVKNNVTVKLSKHANNFRTAKHRSLFNVTKINTFGGLFATARTFLVNDDGTPVLNDDGTNIYVD